jgi:predicted Zn finger-like uncharacterized protein
MYTRCPECQSIHVLNASLLAHARGSVKCGRCGRKFDALESLFDEWPDPADTPPPAGTRYRPQVLGSEEDLPEPFGPASRLPPRKPGTGPAWVLILLLLTLATLTHLAWTFRSDLLRQPQVEAVLAHWDLVDPRSTTSFRDTGQVQLLSRDVHSHPTRAGMLVLSATFVNRAAQAQAWPELELTLIDMSGKPVARRRFSAGEYLPGHTTGTPLLGPEVHVPVLLEFASPGEQATGFEIAFR